MHKHFHNLILGVSVLPALLVLPAMATNVDNWADFTAAIGNGGDIRLTDSLTPMGASSVVADTVIDGGNNKLLGVVYDANQLGVATTNYVWDYTKTDESTGTVYASSSTLTAGTTVLYSDADLTQEFGTITMKVGSNYSVDAVGTVKNLVRDSENDSGRYLAFKDENDNPVFAFVQTNGTVDDISASTKFYSSASSANQLMMRDFADDGEGNYTIKELESFTVVQTEKPHLTYQVGNQEYYMSPSIASTIVIKNLSESKTLSPVTAYYYDGRVVTNATNFVVADNVDFTLKNISAGKNLFSTAGAALVSTANTSSTDKLGSVTIDNVNIDGAMTTNRFGGVATLYNRDVNISNSAFNNTVMNTLTSGNTTEGAAFYAVNSDVLIGQGVSFQNNTAGRGGAVSIDKGSTLKFATDTLFKNNSATHSSGGKGGAIFVNDSKSSFDLSGATFEGNTAVVSGGAVFVNSYDSTKTINIGNAKFIGNIAQQAGAVYLPDLNCDVYVGAAEFKNNKAIGSTSALGGAIGINANDVVRISGAALSGEDLDNQMTALKETVKTFTVDGARFIGNEASFVDEGGMYWGAGGAIGQSMITKVKSVGTSAKPAYLYTVGTMVDINNAYFESNIAGAEGGALNSDSELKITNSTFVGNKTLGEAIGTNLNDSNEGGGAIFMYDDSVATITNTTFESNQSGTWGGAIATRGISSMQPGADGALTVSGGAFNANSAVYGGAIANSLQNKVAEETITKYGATINGVTFTNNTATQSGGAIYNVGDITLGGTNVFAGNTANGKANDIYNIGTLTVASGMTTMDGGITGDGTLSIADGATLDIGNASIAQSTINLGGTLIANLVAGDTAAFSATEFNNIDNKGRLALTIEKAGTYNVFANAKFDKAEEQVSNSIFDLDWSTNEGRTVVAIKKSVEDIATDNEIAIDTATVVSRIADSAAAEDTTKQMKELSVQLQEKLLAGDTAAVEHATKAVHPEQESVTQSVSSSVQKVVVDLAAARMASHSVGRNGGDVELTSGGVWAQGLFNKSKQDDAFNGYTRGIAIGSDATINKHWTIGAGYSFAHSDIDGTSRSTEIDSNTVFVYGQYKPSEWYMNAIVNYTMSDYSEKGTVIDNILVTGDYSVDSFGGAFATGYDFSNGVTPEIGLRYMHVSADDYANSYGIKTHIDDSDFLTGIIGAKYEFDVAVTKRMKFTPQLNAGVKYDFLSDKQVATVAMPGLNAYTLEGNRLNRIGGEFGLGLGMQYRSLEMSLNYDIDVREDYTSQTGMLKFRYNF